MENAGYVHLLLNAPGQPPATLPDSPWRMWTVSDRGATDAAAAAAAARPSPMSPRAERSLLAAVAHDDVDTLVHLGGQKGPTQDAARVLAAGRLATLDVPAAVDLLDQIVAGPAEPWANKVLRRHWRGLHVHLTLAPSVPALYPVGRPGLALLRSEMLAAAGRVPESVAGLEALPPQPAVVLALAATLLTHGDLPRVIEVTTRVENVDDLSALTLVARSVAARTLDDLTTALDAACAALSVGTRNPAILATALEERAHLHARTGDDRAAQADLEALADLAGGAPGVAVPEASGLRPPAVAHDAEPDDALDRARHRLRRRITGVGAPGTFGGRHHSTYRDEVATMVGLGQLDAVEELLLGLMDAVEDEVTELGAELDPTFFLTLGDLYQDSGRADDDQALRERFAAARDRAGATGAAPAAVDPAGEGGDRPVPLTPVAEPLAAPPADPFAPVTDPVPAGTPDVDDPADRRVAAAADPEVAGDGADARGPDRSGAAPAPPVGPDPTGNPTSGVDPVAPGATPEGDVPADPGGEPAGVGNRAPGTSDTRTASPVERAVRGPRVRSL